MNTFLTELIASTFFLYVILATNNNAIAAGAALAIAMVFKGEVNPAVTTMRIMQGKLMLNDALPIILVQIAGGLIALEMHKRIGL